MKRCVLLAVAMISFGAIAVESRDRQFILGADISWVDADVDRGTKFSDGEQNKSIFDILKDHKFNLIRLRVFVDPSVEVPGEQWDSPYSMQGYCGLERTIEFAKQIKKAGMMFSLDFHYSDTWADPGKQHKPMSWRDLSYEELVKKVRTYTRESLEACEEAGVLPDMVQVGNEIVGGMIWPDGSSSNMKKFAELVNAGIDGVKDVSDGIDIFIHSISDAAPSSWLSSLIKAGVARDRIDIFGLSYYEEWHGTPNDLKRNLTEITKNHDIHVCVAEYAEVHEQVNDIVFNLPDEEGIGTIVWEPTKWHDALFNGGSTNRRIDLYPELWKRYGNDTLPQKDRTVPVFAGGNATDRNPWYNSSGITPAGNIVLHGDYFITDLQGRVTATSKTYISGGTFNTASSKIYLLYHAGENGRQSGSWLLNRVR